MSEAPNPSTSQRRPLLSLHGSKSDVHELYRRMHFFVRHSDERSQPNNVDNGRTFDARLSRHHNHLPGAPSPAHNDAQTPRLSLIGRLLRRDGKRRRRRFPMRSHVVAKFGRNSKFRQHVRDHVLVLLDDLHCRLSLRYHSESESRTRRSTRASLSLRRMDGAGIGDRNRYGRGKARLHSQNYTT